MEYHSIIKSNKLLAHATMRMSYKCIMMKLKSLPIFGFHLHNVLGRLNWRARKQISCCQGLSLEEKFTTKGPRETFDMTELFFMLILVVVI